MPRISRADALESKIIAEAEEKAFAESLPNYLRVRYLSVLGNMLRRRDKRLADKAAAARARKAERDASTLPPRPDWQGDNGRLIRS
jgi:hypothetical protein